MTCRLGWPGDRSLVPSIKYVLVPNQRPEDRFARSRLAPHNVNACFEKASSQNDVEARDAGGHALKGRLPGAIDWIGSHGYLTLAKAEGSQ